VAKEKTSVSRRQLIAGNWKMNLNRAGAVALAEVIVRGAGGVSHVDLAICPPSVYLEAVGKVVQGTPVALGAQNAFYRQSGAFTGEISPTMLVDLGCRYVILGHSERRHILRETSEEVNRKVHAALQVGLIPIVCVGELLAEREAGETAEVIRRQFDGSLSGLTAEQMVRVVIAYEPVWAIGTGKVATTEQAQEVHALLRQLLQEKYDGQVAESVRILYGGSVNPENAGPLLAQPDIDGVLVGGASLKGDQFLAIAAQGRRT
jgi:triosephosphate isomerase